MPPVKDHALSIWQYFQKQKKVDPQKLQDLFDREHVNINLTDQTGLDQVVRIGNSQDLGVSKNEKMDFYFGEMDMTDMDRRFSNKQFFCNTFVDDVMQPGKFGRSVYVYREGEQYPRRLSYNKETRDFELSVPANELLRPEKPGPFKLWLMGVLNKIFGAYEKELRDIEEADRKYEERLTFLGDPGAERRERARQEQEAAANAERIAEDRAESYIRELLDGVNTSLNKLYGGIEEKTNREIDRLDYVMINGKTLRALVQEDCRNKDADQGEYVEKGYGTYTATLCGDEHRKEMLKRAGEIILHAMETGKTVVCCKVDPETYELVRDEKGKVVETELDKPGFYRQISEPEHVRVTRKILEKTKVDLESPEEKDDRWKQIDECREGIEMLNYTTRVDFTSSKSPLAEDNLMRYWEVKNNQRATKLPNKDGFTVDRVCLPTHIIGHLLDKGWTLEQIADPKVKTIDPENPDPTRDDKGILGAEMIEAYKNSDYLSMARANIHGQKKLLKLIDEKFGEIDLSDDKALFSEENRCVLGALFTLFDMTQESDHMTKECMQVIAEDEGLDLSDPEQAKKAEQLREELYNRAQSVSTMRSIWVGRENAARMKTGDVYQHAGKLDRIMSGEIYRTKMINGAKEGKRPWDYCSADDATIMTTAFGFLVTAEKAKYAGSDHDGPFTEMTDFRTAEEARSFASKVLSGELRREYDMDIHLGETGVVGTFEKKPQAVSQNAAPQKAEDLIKDGAVIENAKNVSEILPGALSNS